MLNNDILRRLRYTFDLDDQSMLRVFKLGGLDVKRAQLLDWLRKEDDPQYTLCADKVLAHWLAGFIIEKRGPSDRAPLPVEERLIPNVILRKLKIALNFSSEDMLAIFALADFRLGSAELSAFFRKPGHKNYRECKDQVLRNFLQGLQLRFRP